MDHLPSIVQGSRFNLQLPTLSNKRITVKVTEKVAGKEGRRPKAGQRVQTSRGPDKAGYEVGQRQDVGLLRLIIGQSNGLTFGKRVALCSSVGAPQRPGGREPDSSSCPSSRLAGRTSAHSALTSPLRLPRRRPELHSSSAGGALRAARPSLSPHFPPTPVTASATA